MECKTIIDMPLYGYVSYYCFMIRFALADSGIHFFLFFQLLLNFISIAILGIILFEIVGDRDMALIGFRIKKIPVCILFLMTWSIWH